VATQGVLIQPHTLVCDKSINIFAATHSTFINWQFSWIEHNSSNKPVSAVPALPLGELGGWLWRWAKGGATIGQKITTAWFRK